MGTEEKVADAASQKQGRPCMEAALRLPSCPPPEVKCVCPALFTGDGASRTSSFLSVGPHCGGSARAFTLFHPGGGGWGWGKGESASQREQNVHAKRWSSTSRSSDRKAQEIALA